MIDAGITKNERAKLFPYSIAVITFHTLFLSVILAAAISSSHEMHCEIPYSLIKYHEQIYSRRLSAWNLRRSSARCQMAWKMEIFRFLSLFIVPSGWITKKKRKDVRTIGFWASEKSITSVTQTRSHEHTLDNGRRWSNGSTTKWDDERNKNTFFCCVRIISLHTCHFVRGHSITLN